MPPKYRNNHRLVGQLPNPDGPRGRKRNLEKMVYDARELKKDSEAGFTADQMGLPVLARLEIPVREVEQYRDIADKLRRLANTYDLLARQRDRPDWTLALEAVWETRQLTKQMKQIARYASDPTKSGGSGRY